MGSRVTLPAEVVALVTDGRMSGASGKVPSAIHVSPEAFHGGPLGKVQDGDMVRVCATTGKLEALVDAAEWDAREQASPPPPAMGTGRELFAMLRHHSDPAEKGGSAMLAEVRNISNVNSYISESASVTLAVELPA